MIAGGVGWFQFPYVATRGELAEAGPVTGKLGRSTRGSSGAGVGTECHGVRLSQV